MTLRGHLDAFLHSLAHERGRSPLTVRNYRSVLYRFLKAAKRTGSAPLTASIVDRYLAVRATAVAPGTLQLERAALRSFLSYLQARGVRAPSPQSVVRPRLPRSSVAPLPPSLTALLHRPVPERTPMALRDRAVLILILGTGLRVAELVSLNRADLAPTALSVSVPGPRARVLPLPPTLRRAISAYLAVRTDSDPALFVRHGTNLAGLSTLRLTPRTIERLIAGYALRRGIQEPVTPERLRATHIAKLALTEPVPTLCARLGHAHEASTRRHYPQPRAGEV